ncbi:MAG: hypothetical protein LBQ22_08080 [Bacteroidales bacterium]|jgi:hypothetical protein|nr:hypothetical protein [Bacteroidales bacterium]
MKQIKLVLVSILLLCSTSMFAEDKIDIVTLTTTAEGKTKDEAVTNALRNAIEQAFGTFISSKTEMVNDELIKDDIVSVSNGNIQRYDILSSTILANGNTAVSVKSTVSVLKLTKYSESKGINIEYKGGLFAANMKLQQLYEKNELEAIKNLKLIIAEMIPSSFDYVIEVKDPIKSSPQYSKDRDLWRLDHTITISPNKNIENIQSILISTLSGLAMNDSEIANYHNAGKYTFTIGLNVISSKIEQNKDKKETEKKKKEKKNNQEKTSVGQERAPQASIGGGMSGTINSKNQSEGQMLFVLRSSDSYGEMSSLFKLMRLKKINCEVKNGLSRTIFVLDGVSIKQFYDKAYLYDGFIIRNGESIAQGNLFITSKGQSQKLNENIQFYSATDINLNFHKSFGEERIPGRAIKPRTGWLFSFQSKDLIDVIEYKTYLHLTDIEKIQTYTVKPYSPQ